MAARPGEGPLLKLDGHRCTLRRWAKSDVASLVRHANNLNVAKHLRDRFPHPYTRTHAFAFLTHAAASDAPANFAIVVGGEAVGGIGYVRGSDVERYSAEVGYWLGEEFWGRGIATEALQISHTISSRKSRCCGSSRCPSQTTRGRSASSRRSATNAKACSAPAASSTASGATSCSMRASTPIGRGPSPIRRSPPDRGVGPVRHSHSVARALTV